MTNSLIASHGAALAPLVTDACNSSCFHPTQTHSVKALLVTLPRLYRPVRAIVSYPFFTGREGPEQLLLVLPNGQQLTRQSFTATVRSVVAVAGVPSQSTYWVFSPHRCSHHRCYGWCLRILLPSGRSAEERCVSMLHPDYSEH